MSTPIRPEVSEKNRYWISRHRYYELKHFCLQYPDWKRALEALSMYPVIRFEIPQGTTSTSDPVTRQTELRDIYKRKIEMVEKAARDASSELAHYILDGVTRGHAYNCLRLKTDIPCCKDVYYELYRKFFWLLSQARQ